VPREIGRFDVLSALLMRWPEGQRNVERQAATGEWDAIIEATCERLERRGVLTRVEKAGLDDRFILQCYSNVVAQHDANRSRGRPWRFTLGRVWSRKVRKTST
jgi:hypothetical protein